MNTQQQTRAIEILDSLRKEVKAGKTNCINISAILLDIIENKYWDYWQFEGEDERIKLRNLIVSPLAKGGLGLELWQFEALISLNKPALRKFRSIVYAETQGKRNDLEPEPQLLGELSKPAQARHRAAERAASAIPAIDKLLDEGLISTDTAAQLGPKIKDPENPTPKEKEATNRQQQAQQELDELLENKPLPQNKQQRKQLAKEVKETVEKITKPKKSQSKAKSSKSQSNSKNKAEIVQFPIQDPTELAKSLANSKGLDYLEQLKVAVELEIETLLNSETLAA